MKKYIIKLGYKIMIPVAILAGISFVFDKELSGFHWVFYARCILLIFAILLIISGILEFIDKYLKK
jgi:hypothetical protein